MLWSWKKQRCRDGVMSDFVSWCRHLLVPSFFMKRHPYIPLHFIEMIFPLVPHIFLLGQSPNKYASREHVYIYIHTLRTRMRTRTTPPRPLRTCTRACYGVIQCLPMKSPTIYRRNLRREENDRLVSVHTSIDCGEVW